MLVVASAVFDFGARLSPSHTAKGRLREFIWQSKPAAITWSPLRDPLDPVRPVLLGLLAHFASVRSQPQQSLIGDLADHFSRFPVDVW